MKNFFKITEGVDVLQIMGAVMRHPELWNSSPIRTTFEDSPHVAVDDIILRFGSVDGDDLEAADRHEMALIAGAKLMALNILKLVNGSRLGRVVITKLEPGQKILAHKDTEGDYAKYYTRYHVVLQGLPGALFTCGDETVNMRTGELWWFNAAEMHSVINNSPDDRMHMLVDVRIDP